MKPNVQGALGSEVESGKTIYGNYESINVENRHTAEIKMYKSQVPPPFPFVLSLC